MELSSFVWLDLSVICCTHSWDIELMTWREILCLCAPTSYSLFPFRHTQDLRHTVVFPIQTSLRVINNFVYLCCSYEIKEMSFSIKSFNPVWFLIKILCVCYSLRYIKIQTGLKSFWLKSILTHSIFTIKPMWPVVAPGTLVSPLLKKQHLTWFG